MPAGFKNGEIMFCDNVSFDGTESPGKITTDGQLIIGSTAAPNLKIGTIVSPDDSIEIGYDGTNITVETSGLVVQALLATTVNAVTGDNTLFNPIFDLTYINDGSAYDTTTGIFTAPSFGRYFYSIQISYTGITSLNLGSLIISRQNGIQIQASTVNIANVFNPLLTIATIMMTGIIELDTGDTLDFLTSVAGEVTKNANFFGTLNPALSTLTIASV